MKFSQPSVTAVAARQRIRNSALLVLGIAALFVSSAAGAVIVDSTTQGSWTNKYGSSGYILNSYNVAPGGPYAGISAANDVTALPSFVAVYSYASSGASAGTINWGVVPLAGSPMALQNPSSPANGKFTTMIDLNTTESIVTSLTLTLGRRDFHLATYLVAANDSSPWGATVSLKWADQGTPFATSTFINYTGYTNGTWLVFDVPSNAETQLDIIVTGNGSSYPAMSAIMFDAVPEPSTIMLFGIGAAVLWLRRRHQR